MNENTLTKEAITAMIALRYKEFGKNVDTSSSEWKLFRQEVYRLNELCFKLDNAKYLEVQSEFEDHNFCSDDVSRCSSDSSVFLPQLPNHLRNSQRSLAANAAAAKVASKPTSRFGGV